MGASRWASLFVTLLCGGLLAPAHADPWLAPGDEGLRADIQLLADAGVLRGPVTTWPLSWPDVARDVLAADIAALPEGTAAALIRVQRLARNASGRGFSGLGLRAAAAHEPVTLRGFADTPREEAEAGIRGSWLGDHVAVNLQGSYVADPDDGRGFRPDGSYLGVNVGNFMISAGFMERWWSPGWEGSLILSTNARPIPSITLERNYTDPFESRLLSWLGPWRASIAVGEMEGSGVEVPDVRFLAARATFKPRPWLEFALTRTAQWCGGTRECGWKTFTNMLLGRDNQVENGEIAEVQPGNQMAGYDLRLRSPWRALPLAFYGQWIGEDEAGGLPSKFLGLMGLETWADTGYGNLHVHIEYADTTCNFSRESPSFGCAYRNGLYPQGYAYRGRVIGHAVDNDSRMYSAGASLVRPGGDALSLLVRRVELNRDGGSHAISALPFDFNNVELRYSKNFEWGRVGVGVGHDDADGLGQTSRLRGFLSWQQGF
jgi:hypothetical protein